MKASEAYQLSQQALLPQHESQILEQLLANVKATALMGGDSLEMELNVNSENIPQDNADSLVFYLTFELRKLGYLVKTSGPFILVSWSLADFLNSDQEDEDLLDLPEKN